ncbi:MAG: glycosyltransferase [Bacteroidota bacterium]|nr:glycosyltransferase [Bacteroidota bacterium]
MNPVPNVVLVGVSYFDGMASSTRVRNLLDPLVHKNYIKVSNLIYQKDANGLTGKKGELKNISYEVIGFGRSNPFSIISFLLNGIRFLNKNKSHTQKNILYNYDQPDLKNILFILYARLIGFKVILDIIEDNRFYTKFPRLLTKIKIKSSVFFIKHVNLFADGIISISNHLQKEMEKISKDKIPVFLIPITVDLNRFKKNTYAVPKNFKIFYGGSFGEKDGLEYLIAAFENIFIQFKNVTLLFTGRGADHDMKRIYQLIENSPAKENILFMGFLESDEYYNLINECDIFCMTRVNSKFANAGFPFKLGEFLATGKAVIATNVGDVNKYIQNQENAQLIIPSSVEEITKALLYLLKNPEQITIMGTKGRKTAENYFDSEKISMELFSIFNSI